MDDRRETLTGIALVNVATLAWATNMLLGRWLRADIGPITLAAARMAIAAIPFAWLLSRRPPEDRRVGPDRGWMLAMALCGVTLFGPTLYLGLRYTTTVNATLINGFGPIITGFLSFLLIHEPMTRRQLAGAVVGLAGIAVLITGGSAAAWRSLQVNIGDLIVLAAIALWGLYSVLARRVMRHRSALSASAFSAFLGLPLLLVGSAWELQTLPMNLTGRLAPFIVYIALVPTVIGMLAWNEGVRRLGSSGAMVFYNTMPVYGGLLGALILGETVGAAHLIGGALIISGGLWASRSPPAKARS
jgi:drug/metabolite transporter (DMT)-like permease